MRFDTVSYDLDLAEDERCFYHYALQHTARPMCLGVSDRALFIARERFLKLQAYTMHRIPLTEVREVILSRERGTWVWLKWAILLAFGITLIILMVIGLMAAPNPIKPGIGAVGPIAFTAVGLAMLIDRRWRLVLTIRTQSKDWQWRPHAFDKRDEVKALREGFLDACQYIRIPTRRLDLVNESEIRAFWRWFESRAMSARIDVSAVTSRLHKLCNRIDVEIKDEGRQGNREMIFTANYARDAFPIVEELVFAAPQIRDLSVTAFKPRQKSEKAYIFEGVEFSSDKIFFVPYSDGFELAIYIYADLETIDHDVIWALCRDLLGEYDFVCGVQYMQIIDLGEATHDLTLHNISELFEFVDDFHRLDIA